MEKLVLVGAGPFAKCIINYIEDEGQYEIVGYTDIENNGNILDYNYLGKDEEVLPKLLAEGVTYAVVGVGNHLNDCTIKEKITNKVKNYGFILPVIHGKFSVVHRGAVIEEGVIIRNGAIIQAGAVIRAHSMIGDRVLIGHDTVVDSYVHVVAGSSIGRDCRIGKGTLIGNGSTVLNGVRISNNVLIGAKSLVNRDCLEVGRTYFGCPAKLIEKNNG